MMTSLTLHRSQNIQWWEILDCKSRYRWNAEQFSNKTIGENKLFREKSIFQQVLFLCLDVLTTEIQETVENNTVFDPDFHTELTNKDEFEDLDSGNSHLGK